MVDDVPHHDLAKDLYNRTWDRIELDERSDDDDLDMLLTAAASRWHWGEVDPADHRATGDWQVSHVLSLLGAGELALRFAERGLRTLQRHGTTGWRLASAHEGVARAQHVVGDAAARATHVAKAFAALDEEPDEDAAAMIAMQLADLTEDPT